MSEEESGSGRESDCETRSGKALRGNHRCEIVDVHSNPAMISTAAESRSVATEKKLLVLRTAKL